MAVTYAFDEKNGLVLLTATGPTSMADVSEIHAQLRQDPQFRPEYRELFDFREATPTDIRGNQIQSLLHRAPYGMSSRRAYVVAPGVGYGLGRVAEAMAEYQKLTLRVFLDIDAAREWLLQQE